MRASRRIELMLKILVGLAAANLALLSSILWILLWADDAESEPPVSHRSATAAPVSTSAGASGSSPVPASGPTGSRMRAPTAAAEGPPSTVGELLDVTVEPMARAARDRGIDVSAQLPTAAERAAISAEGTLAGPTGAAVLKRLRVGYDAVGMPFPDIPMEPQGDAEPPGTVPAAATGGVDSKAVQTWLELTVRNATEAAAANGTALSLPTESAQAAAVASGSFDSAATREVMGPLREAYAALGLDFPEPGGAPAPSVAVPGSPASAGTSRPSSAPGGAAASASTQDQKILRAFFTVRSQELAREASAQGKPAPAPSAAVVDAAVQSGDIRSTASRSALDAYAQAYAELGLTWRDPVGG